MKQFSFLIIAFFVLMTNAQALPQEILDAAPKAAENLEIGEYSTNSFSLGIEQILKDAEKEIHVILKERVKSAATVLLAVILCSMAREISREEKHTDMAFSMAGALCVTALTAGSLESLIGLGWKTVRELHTFSKALLPTLAAATAASGAVTTATFQQVSAVFLTGLLIDLMDGLLMPLTYLYIGVLTASCSLPENRLSFLASGLKKTITTILTISLLAFTMYLSVSKIISGAADGATVKATKNAISNVVPVVGGIISEASEVMLVGAGILKNSIGVFGMLAILAACAYPFLQLGIQYIIYKITAFLSSIIGMSEICQLIDGLGDAFGLVLGMTGSCAFLLFLAVLNFVSAIAI